MKKSTNKKQPTKSELDALKRFGAHIRAIRLQKSLTLEQCEELGFPSWRNLSDIENGQNCTFITVLRLAKIFNMKVSDLADY